MNRDEFGAVVVALGLAASAAFFVAFRSTSLAVSLAETYLERRQVPS
ncbi:MAG: hypothetical protein WBD41_07935 [Rhodococcus sp. (in: high G+C Gram-positive bacteria)]